MLPRLLGLLLLAALALTGPALAEKLNIIPVPPQVQPQWTPLPANPRVSYAPNVPTDVFRYRARYYLFWEGSWYRSGSLKGPWKLLTRVPPALAYLDTSAFKQTQKRQAPPPAPQVTPPPLPPGTAGPPPAPQPPPPEEAPPPGAPPGEPPPAPKMM